MLDVPYHVGRIPSIARPWLVDQGSVIQLSVDVDVGVKQQSDGGDVLPRTKRSPMFQGCYQPAQNSNGQLLYVLWLKVGVIAEWRVVPAWNRQEAYQRIRSFRSD